VDRDFGWRRNHVPLDPSREGEESFGIVGVLQVVQTSIVSSEVQLLPYGTCKIARCYILAMMSLTVLKTIIDVVGVCTAVVIE